MLYSGICIFLKEIYKHSWSKSILFSSAGLIFLSFTSNDAFSPENRRSLTWGLHFDTFVFWRYQLELCKKALEENIIVYLGTGYGKTHIAVLLIYELGHLIRKPQKNICIFLAPTVALVQQVSCYLSFCWFYSSFFQFWEIFKFGNIFVVYMVVTLLHNSGVVLLLIVGLMPTYAISHYEPRVQGRADSTCFIMFTLEGSLEFYK